MRETGFRSATEGLRGSLAIASAITLTVLVGSGCGSDKKTYSVTGTVRFEDRAPLRKGQVVFQSEGLSAYGDIQDDGSFEMGTYEATDGVPAGKYAVFLAGDLYADLPAAAPASQSTDHELLTAGDQLLVDPSMCGPASGIEFQVEPHHRNNLEIIAKRPGATASR